MAYESGFTDSTVISATYTIGSGGGTVAMPAPLLIQVGDHVVMSAAYCTHCVQCRCGHVAYCENLFAEDFGGRRTSDGTSATTTNGTLLVSGAQWTDCGPLAGYKFTAVSGSPTLDVEYYK